MLWMLLAGCGAMNTARPLEPGQHAVGVTLGGPIVDAGFASLPLPNLVAEGRSGLVLVLDRPLDLNYGLNVTGLPFGVVGGHVGASWLILDQNGGIPALSVSDRLYLASNHLDTREELEGRALWVVDELALTASWDTEPALLYVGAAQYLDFANPGLLLSPYVGSEFHLGERWGLQLEVRHLGINQSKYLNTIQWVSWGPGAISATVGVSRELGAR